jgi:CDP-diacylglycerol--glycerol-3-phosphate 3-phosphatidyltransferase
VNLPNKLTMARVLMIPVCLVLQGINTTTTNFVAAGVFALAALTDLLDGRIARKRGLVTNFGKFADPIADKLLAVSSMTFLCAQGKLPAWMFVIVLMREFAVSGLRLIAVEQGKVIAAGMLGKVKTNLQFYTVLALLMGNWPFSLIPFPMTTVLMYAMTALTLWSGIDYFIKGRGVLKG